MASSGDIELYLCGMSGFKYVNEQGRKLLRKGYCLLVNVFS